MNYANNEIICPWCSSCAKVIWVHGHGQCSNCGINIDECCRGEQSSAPEKTETPNTEDND